MPHEIPFGIDITLALAWGEELPPNVDPRHRATFGTLEVRVSPAGGRLHGTRDVVVAAESLERFGADVTELLDRLTGEATFEPTPGLGGRGDFALTVRLRQGKGTVSGFLATQYPPAHLTFEGIEIDQSYLAGTLRELRSLLAAR